MGYIYCFSFCNGNDRPFCLLCPFHTAYLFNDALPQAQQHGGAVCFAAPAGGTAGEDFIEHTGSEPVCPCPIRLADALAIKLFLKLFQRPQGVALPSDPSFFPPCVLHARPVGFWGKVFCRGLL